MTTYAVVLGGTQFQEGFVKSIIKNGCQPIVLDWNKECYLSSKVDHFFQVDIKDIQGCYEAIKDFDIVGIFTGQSDIGVPTMGALNDRLLLEGVSMNAAEAASDKSKFRDIMKMNGVPQPKYTLASSIEDIIDAVKYVSLPCIVKPVDSSGSRGITILKDTRDVESALKHALKYSRQEHVLVEEYITGTEYGSQTYSIKGDIAYSFLHTDWTVRNIPVGHCMPIPSHNKLSSDMQDVCKKAMRALSYTGPGNVDLIVDKNNSVYVLEIGARIGATLLPDLVSLAHNINVYDVQVSNVLHKSFSYNEHTRTVTNSGVRILSSECDLRISLDKLNGFYDFSELLRKELGITQISLDLEQPSLVQSLNSGVDRYGMLTISNPNMEADDMQKTLDEANNRIQEYFSVKL